MAQVLKTNSALSRVCSGGLRRIRTQKKSCYSPYFHISPSISRLSNLVEEVILTLPISRYSEPDDECNLETVHTSIVSAHETLDEIDALYIRLTDISQGIKEGHI